MPIFDDQLDHLQGAKYYTTLDLTSTFFDVPIAEASRKYTSFVVEYGKYQFKFCHFKISRFNLLFLENQLYQKYLYVTWMT